MSIIQKSSLDNLNVNSYAMTIDKLPDFNYKLKEVNTPSFTLPEIKVDNPFQKMNVAGTTLDYTSLSVSFIIDENAANYIGVYNWMSGLGFPDSYEQFRKLTNSEINVETKKSYSDRETSDITLHLLTNHRNTNRIIRYYNAFPISLSGFTLMNSNTDAEVIQATVEFSYTGMKFTI